MEDNSYFDPRKQLAKSPSRRRIRPSGQPLGSTVLWPAAQRNKAGGDHLSVVKIKRPSDRLEGP